MVFNSKQEFFNWLLVCKSIESVSISKKSSKFVIDGIVELLKNRVSFDGEIEKLDFTVNNKKISITVRKNIKT
jgi:hypothetical protein